MANKSDNFLYVPSTGKIRIKVRFVGEQVEMFQYFNKGYFNGNADPGSFGAFPSPLSPLQGEKVFFREDDNGDVAYSRSKRIVSLVIDRSDEKIKAFACPVSVWNQMTEFAKENDFEIWREGHGLQTRYFVDPCGLSEITDNQERTVEATLESFSFADIFIKKKWELVDEVIERIENRWQILDL